MQQFWRYSTLILVNVILVKDQYIYLYGLLMLGFFKKIKRPELRIVGDQKVRANIINNTN